jgi:hypothetical protein
VFMKNKKCFLAPIKGEILPIFFIGRLQRKSGNKLYRNEINVLLNNNPNQLFYFICGVVLKTQSPRFKPWATIL